MLVRSNITAIWLVLLWVLLLNLSWRSGVQAGVVLQQQRRSAGVTQNTVIRNQGSVSCEVAEDGTEDCSALWNEEEEDEEMEAEEEEYDEEQEYDYDEESVTAEASAGVPSPAVDPNVDALGSDMGVEQALDTTHHKEIMDRLSDARRYLQEVVAPDEKYAKIRGLCQNKHESCAFWAILGECDSNPGYMHVNCAPVCQTCDMLHVETRCPMDPNARDAFYPGELQQMFERIESDPYYQEQYGVKVLSRPEVAPKDVGKDWNDLEYTVGGPWMVMFEHAVTDEEADRLIELGRIEGYERSADVGEELPDGTYTADVNNGRTSTNAWCQDVCYEDPVARDVMNRIANITGTPEPNSEYLQMLRYTTTQFYQTHSDYIPYQVDRPCGVRALTFYIYLSDVEEGGGTNFPKLDLTVTPKKGRAVLWPSVHNDDPNAKDGRTDHQALPVIKGIKYGANAWIHQRSFKDANVRGCT